MNRKYYFLNLISFTCFVYLAIIYLMKDERRLDERNCPGVLRYMTSGKWQTRDLTSQEQKEIYDFLSVGRYYLPNSTNYERLDLKCGNLSYIKNEHSKWFRVLCSPSGPTPCCFNNQCIYKTVDECRGPFTYDLRSRIHAEYSKWLPLDKRCSVKLFNSESACDILEGSTLFLAGDSLMRGLYIALIQILSGDLQTGALKQDTPEHMKRECAGMYSYHHKGCSKYLDFQPKLCNGSLKLNFKYYGSIDTAKHFRHDALQLKGKNNSMIFVGVGLWDYYNYNSVINAYLSPMLRDIHSYPNYSYWPKILWASAHQLGLWRYPFVKTVDNVHGKQFNDKMAEYLFQFSIPVFDTFNLTEGVMTIDGTHYGLGINMLKAQLYLNYMQELKDHQLWGQSRTAAPMYPAF